ncbi:hypothetical protein [Chryseobacterium terrae]|uniref:Addiction module component n=1 Tax=Chryseobacterium terrae TaxID=3163299 RepID=A0ABW8Y0S6_9FLAO
MEIRININEYADVSYIKNLLSKVKGVVSIETDEDENYSWEEIENSEVFAKVIEQSRKDFEEGRYIESTPELIESLFRKK